MSIGAGGVAGIFPTEIIARHIIEGHHDWKYSIELTVGPADARWVLKAKGDVLKEVIADIAKQRELMCK